MEELVSEYLEDVLKDRDDVCKCEYCLIDMATYALNKLQPLYYSRHQGMIFSRLEEFENQMRADIITVLITGIEKVSKSPHHNEIDGEE